MTPLALRLRDPRLLQIAFHSSFLLLGIGLFEFSIPPLVPALVCATTCATQWAYTRLLKLPAAGYLSPLITGLGTSLLLRSDVLWLPPLAGFLAISSKFLLRKAGRHLFNPTTFGLGVTLLLTAHAWCSPSEWVENGAVLAWITIVGLAVVHRAFRSDVTLAFLFSWFALKAGRVLYLGQRPEVLLHQLGTGSLIIFAFFMISDPKTTPSQRKGRLLFGAGVAALAFTFQHALWWTNGLVWALLLCAPLVPLLDRIFPAERYRWPTEPRPPPSAASSTGPAPVLA